MKKIFILFMLSMLGSNVIAEDEFYLKGSLSEYLKDYSYAEKSEERLSGLLCDCMKRFDALKNLVKKHDLPTSDSEGVLIANYSLAYLTMDVYSFTKYTTTSGAVKYIGKSNSYGVEKIRKVYANPKLVSSAVSNFLENRSVVINEMSSITDTGCYYIYVFRNNESKSWLVPFEILQDPGVLDGTFFEPAEDILISSLEE